MIKENELIKLDNGLNFKILRKLGEGGQGQVYIGEIADKTYALKLLNNFNGEIITESDSIAVNIETLINMTPPCDKFIWPKYSVVYHGQYGYIMDLIPYEYKELSLWLNADPSFNVSSIISLIDISLNIIIALNTLRKKGYSYQDLNASNIFVNPKTGDIKICDCDNICPTDNNYGVIGKKGFQAPEVILGEKPSIYSDIFSLTLMLYYIWCKDNPFDGLKTMSIPLVTDDIIKEIYGINPIFTYHPLDSSNRPDKNIQSGSYYLWPLLPNYIKEGFIKTFTEGIHNIQNGRLSPKEWINKFLKLRSSIVKCNNCCEENIYSEDNPLLCDKCLNEITPKYIIEFNKFSVPVSIGTTINRYHIEEIYNHGIFDVIGIIIPNKKYPGIFGLKNLSDMVWKLIQRDKQEENIYSEGIVIIADGTKIIINDTICQIKKI